MVAINHCRHAGIKKNIQLGDSWLFERLRISGPLKNTSVMTATEEFYRATLCTHWSQAPYALHRRFWRPGRIYMRRSPRINSAGSLYLMEHEFSVTRKCNTRTLTGTNVIWLGPLL